MLRHDSDDNSFDGDIGQQFCGLEQPLPGGSKQRARLPKAKLSQRSNAIDGLLRLSVQTLKHLREA